MVSVSFKKTQTGSGTYHMVSVAVANPRLGYIEHLEELSAELGAPLSAPR